MNPDFQFVSFVRIEEARNGTKVEVSMLRVTYKGVGIALFAGEDLEQRAIDHLKVYGYMAEHRRRWNLFERPNWDDSMYVEVDLD